MRDEGKTKEELIKALREATGYFEKLCNSLGDAVFSVRMPERVIKFANIAVEKVFGYTPCECIGRSTSGFYSDEQGYLDFGKKLKDAIDKGQDVLRTEHTLKRKNSELFTAAITTSFLMHDGRLDEVISIVSDITERIRTQDEINKLNAELEQRVIERTSQIEVAKRCLEEDISRRKDAEEALRRSDNLLSLQYKIISILAENAGLNETLKNIIKTICEHIGWELGDVWYVDRDADALRLGEMWYSDFFDGSELEALSRNMVIKRGEGILGLVLQKGEPIWVEDLSVYSHIPRARIVAGVGFKSAFAFPLTAAGIVNGVVVVTGRTMRPPDTDLLNALSAISSQIGNFIEQKRMEDELEKMQRLESLGVLAGGIAHDFNNLLSGVLGNISLAKMYLNPEDRAYKRLEEAEKASVRTKDLTGQLLTFAKGGEPVIKVISVADLLMDSVGFGLSGSRVNCKLSMPDDLWPVNVDEGQIHQVINNLLINADQAMPGSGTIEITCKNTEVKTSDPLPLDEGSYVKISIKDQGIGIPEPLLKRIFDPYFTTKEKGRGLGLATSYSILKRHNGLITVESKENKGTTFHIYLPALPSASISREGSEEIVVSGRGRVLVMDDEDLVIQVAGEMLKALGYEVESANDGLEAIKKYKDAKEKGKPFNAVIMDLTIPGGMGGKEAIVRLKEIDPDVRAIVASGYSNDPVISDFRGFGFSGSLTKPFRIEELSRTVHRVLKHYDANQDCRDNS